MEGIMGLILVVTSPFISNHSKKCIMKSQNSSSKNMLKVCFVCELCSVDTQQINKQIHKISFCFYIVKGLRDATMNLILLLEEPVATVFSHIMSLDKEVKI